MSIKSKLSKDFISILGNLGRTNKSATVEDFFNAITKAGSVSKGGMKIDDMLTPYSKEDYAAMKLFLSKDKKSGFAIKKTPTGKELVSVFSTEKGRGRNLANEGVLRGAQKLDNYNVGGKLPELYGQSGFQQIGEYPFDPAQVMPHVSQFTRDLKPSYVEMSLKPDVATGVSATRGMTDAEFTHYLATGELPWMKRKAVQTAGLASMIGIPAAGYLGYEAGSR